MSKNETLALTLKIITSLMDPDSYKTFLMASNLPKETPFEETKSRFYNYLLNTTIGDDEEHMETKGAVHAEISNTIGRLSGLTFNNTVSHVGLYDKKDQHYSQN